MKRAIFISVFFGAFIISVFAETYVSSEIKKAEQWTAKNGPYIISEEIVITKTGFLTIDPGATIKFKKDGQITVQGALYAKGSPKNPIRFIPFDGESFYKGIRFEGKYKNTIDFAIFIRGAIVVEASSLIFTNNYVLNSTGVEIFHFGKAVVKDNYFYNNTYGVYAEGQKVGINILNNTFNSTRFGVYLKDLKKSNIKINGNNFTKNTVNVTNYSADDYECKNNYWGYTDEKRIMSFLYDKRNNKKVGKLEFRPFKKSPLKLFTPNSNFKSLVKIYLKLKRPDQHTPRVCFGGGLIGFMPLTPEGIKEMADYGLGLSGEFAFSIANPLMLSIEGKMLALESKQEFFTYNLNVTNLLVNFYGYMGWQPRVFLVPYVKIGNGIALISEQFRSDMFLYDNGTSKSAKNNEVSYVGSAGLGVELFVLKFFSIKFDANYCYTLKKGGNLSYPYVNATGNIYFDVPFFLSNN